MIAPARTIGAAIGLAALGACVTANAGDNPLPSALEAGWEGKPVCELLHRSDTHRVLECSFAPGVGHERHFHPAHFGYALSGGTMKLTDANGDRIARIATGSSYSSDGVAWHQVVNVGDTTVTYLIVEEL
ncbi:cupin domain-containing protein [Qipengyuania sp. RANM35]|uniref:cupin domain-containing protein n=1 Tax=Qipengyuania sp. RANM35 TaxID=3068635 RepID=UPI0034DB0CE2